MPTALWFCRFCQVDIFVSINFQCFEKKNYQLFIINTPRELIVYNTHTECFFSFTELVYPQIKRQIWPFWSTGQKIIREGKQNCGYHGKTNSFKNVLQEQCLASVFNKLLSCFLNGCIFITIKNKRSFKAMFKSPINKTVKIAGQFQVRQRTLSTLQQQSFQPCF